ncbi:MAG: LOG family protein [Patescibacteria group bacterium]|mgnify:CR=1 FL=1
MLRNLKTVQKELKHHDFRVAIFGSARIAPDDKIYKSVFALAKEIGKHGFDMVTGGGPGIMDAANAGHQAGDTKNLSDDIGLPIYLPWENEANKHLEIKKNFKKFSSRLDHFMALSSVVVVMPGGIGTCLELFYTWQLIQVKHIYPIPIILVGEMWEELIKWIKKYPLKTGLISPPDLDHIFIAKTNKGAMEIILKTYKAFKEGKLHDNHKYL